MIEWSAGPSAPTIGLIGDSTLSGVRWTSEYGELERFNFLLDAESCRRTIETSCWSREQYRPDNAITVLEDHAGEWGDVLVVMTGYNDSSSGFADGVEAVVQEARAQGIRSVLWLSLRTKGVDYEEPLHLANGSTYRDANRTLYRLADETDGFLQVADWATHAADHPEWFEADGVHLAAPGVEAVTSFITDQVEVALAGGTVTADPIPWEDVRDGDEGDLVAQVQRALRVVDVDAIGVVDGVFGPQTDDAVTEFQRRSGLPVTGVVDEATAVALGLHVDEPLRPDSPVSAPPTTVPSASLLRSAVASSAPGRAAPSLFGSMWWLPVVAISLCVLLLGRLVRGRRIQVLPSYVMPDETRSDADSARAAPYDFTTEPAWQRDTHCG